MLTVTQAAQKCGVPEARIRRAIKSDSIPARKFGSCWAVEPDDLERWFESFKKTRAGSEEIARSKGGDV